MGTLIIYALITLWLVVMVPAAALPFLIERPKQGANVTPTPTTIPFRPQTEMGQEIKPPLGRNAA